MAGASRSLATVVFLFVFMYVCQSSTARAYSEALVPAEEFPNCFPIDPSIANRVQIAEGADEANTGENDQPDKDKKKKKKKKKRDENHHHDADATDSNEEKKVDNPPVETDKVEKTDISPDKKSRNSVFDEVYKSDKSKKADKKNKSEKSDKDNSTGATTRGVDQDKAEFRKTDSGRSGPQRDERKPVARPHNKHSTSGKTDSVNNAGDKSNTSASHSTKKDHRSTKERKPDVEKASQPSGKHEHKSGKDKSEKADHQDKSDKKNEGTTTKDDTSVTPEHKPGKDKSKKANLPNKSDKKNEGTTSKDDTADKHEHKPGKDKSEKADRQDKSDKKNEGTTSKDDTADKHEHKPGKDKSEKADRQDKSDNKNECTTKDDTSGKPEKSEKKNDTKIGKEDTKDDTATKGDKGEKPDTVVKPETKPVFVGTPPSSKPQFAGNASWYGIPFHGRKTASGEIFNMYRCSAAHKTLPLVTKVLVEDPRTGNTVMVRVNDRGPYVGTRVMDLSREAARELGTMGRGVYYIEVTVLGKDEKK